ncbi:hypothetical protein TI04_05050 [Achromatium sp. WMS2]|nr:hypothetical protein TI04_05050 [Achromatium sp. WMS2]
MDIGLAMQAMRDPAGVPAHPVLFQILMVFTWIFHIIFVNLTLGAAGLAIYSFQRRHSHNHWERLSIATTKVAKVGVSLLIVLGVAPLLFTQVIYDPQWYVSNVLSARWAIAFIFTLIIAYCAWFIFYFNNHTGAKSFIVGYAGVALVLFCLDGLIMHVLSYQALLPEQWLAWYAPNGIVDSSGSTLHAILWPRYLFVMSLSVPAIGLFLLAYAEYFSQRADYTPEYLNFTNNLGRSLAFIGFSIALFPLLIWQFMHPAGTGLITNPMGWLLAVSLMAMSMWIRNMPPKVHGYVPLLGGLGVLTLLAIWREIVRIQYLKPFGYSIADYTVNLDLPSTLLFFSTLLGVGGLVGGFYLTLLYRSARVQGPYTAEPAVSKLGNWAIIVLAMWIATFFTYGIVIWVRNSFLV